MLSASSAACLAEQPVKAEELPPMKELPIGLFHLAAFHPSGEQVIIALDSFVGAPGTSGTGGVCGNMNPRRDDHGLGSQSRRHPGRDWTLRWESRLGGHEGRSAEASEISPQDGSVPWPF